MSCSDAVAEALAKCFNVDGDLRIVVIPSGFSKAEDAELSPEPEPVAAEFRVYSKLLRAWSDAFEAMFTHDFCEKSKNKLEIRDFSVAAVEAFLRFLYSGQLSDKPSLAIEVAVLADKYGIPHPKKLCMDRLSNSCDFEATYKMLQSAHELCSEELKSCCLTALKFDLDPEEALRSAHILSPALLDEVLSTVGPCLGDYELAKIIIGWAQLPNGDAEKMGHDCQSLLQKHVRLASLSNEQCREILEMSQARGNMALKEQQLAEQGEFTTDLFKALALRWGKTGCDCAFLGYWLNLIPSNRLYIDLQGLHKLACNESSMQLEAGDEMTWVMPHHGIFVTAVSFAYAVDSAYDCYELYCSVDGSSWDLLLCTNKKTYSCRSKACVKWFKLRVKKGHYSNMLQIHGVLYDL
jgi:hypothetical protein